MRSATPLLSAAAVEALKLATPASRDVPFLRVVGEERVPSTHASCIMYEVLAQDVWITLDGCAVAKGVQARNKGAHTTANECANCLHVLFRVFIAYTLPQFR